MLDLFQDKALHKLLAKVYEASAVLGGVRHGPAVFANVHLSNGAPLAKSRRITGFMHAEEAWSGKRWATSYLMFLETGLRPGGYLRTGGRDAAVHGRATAASPWGKIRSRRPFR